MKVWKKLKKARLDIATTLLGFALGFALGFVGAHAIASVHAKSVSKKHASPTKCKPLLCDQLEDKAQIHLARTTKI